MDWGLSLQGSRLRNSRAILSQALQIARDLQFMPLALWILLASAKCC
jgi:hypothetical protein